MTVTHRHSHTAPSPLTRPQWLLPGLLGPLSRHLLSAANGNASRLGHRPLFAHTRRGCSARAGRASRPASRRPSRSSTTRSPRLSGGSCSSGAMGPSTRRRTRASRRELALIPAGGANNIARSLGIPRRLRRRRTTRRRGASRGRSTRSPSRPPTQNYLAVEGVSAGFHALARSRYTATNSADVRAGIRAGLGAARALRAVHDRVVARRRVTVSCGSASSSSSNMPLFGPGLRVAPADPRDGLLDVVTIDGGRARAARPGPPPSPGHAPRPPGRHAHAGRHDQDRDRRTLARDRRHDERRRHRPAFDRAARARHRRSGGMTSIASAAPPASPSFGSRTSSPSRPPRSPPGSAARSRRATCRSCSSGSTTRPA